MSKWIIRFGILAAALVFGLAAVFVFAGIGLGPCGFSWSPGPFFTRDIQADRWADDKAIYAIVYKDQGFDANPQVIDEKSIPVNFDDFADPNSIPGVSPDTLADFLAKNKEPISLRPLVSDVPHKGVVTHADLDAVLPKDDHGRNYQEIFNEHFSGAHGVLSFSRIGFNNDHTQAVVYFSQWCGSLCARGGLVLYKKSSGSWHKVGGGTRWVS